jgi:transcriptional regulator with XRE-family HTH domain
MLGMTPAKLRDTLKAIGMTQAGFAERLGLSDTTVNRWARGRAPVPGYAEAYLREITAGMNLETKP